MVEEQHNPDRASKCSPVVGVPSSRCKLMMYRTGWGWLGLWLVSARDFASVRGPTRAYLTFLGLVPEALQISPEKWWKEEARPDVQRMAEPLSSFTSLGPSSSISGLRCRKPSCSTDVLKRCLDIARLYTAMYARTPYRSTCQGPAQREVFLQSASQQARIG